MSRRPAQLLFLTALVAAGLLAVSVSSQTRPGQPARDVPAQGTAQEATPRGRLSGRVLAADNGRPIRRARVLATSPQLPQGRGTLTDEAGAFDLTGLPEGRYTLTVSKTGFITLAYGQRRPLQAGTPLQLGATQELTGIEFRLPRGSVITGRILDETGEPVPGSTVRALRYQYTQGNRQLVPAGAAETDDQGTYRIWGLNPGEYYISALARTFMGAGRGGPGPLGGRGGPPGPPPGSFAAQALEARGLVPGNPSDSDPIAYAPTYYPGVPAVNEARPVSVALGAEARDIDFGLLLVRTSRVSGRVVNPDGSPSSTGNVVLVPDTGQRGRGALGGTYGARFRGDGAFAIANVPPGRYMLRARGGGDAQAQFGAQTLTVTDGDLTDVVVVLAPSGSLSGTVTFEAARSAQPPDPTTIRIAALPADDSGFGPNPSSRVTEDRQFVLEGVAAGGHLIRTQGSPRGWMLREVLVDGRDVIDTPLDIRSGQRVSSVTLVFTDNLSEVGGTVTDDRGNPMTEYTVLAFSSDPTYWRPMARQIMTARPDQNGRFQIRGLPAGEYFLTPVDPTEPGEWFEPSFLERHRTGAARVRVGEGDVKTQDFTIAIR